MNTMKRIIVLLTILALSSLACADPTADSLSASSASGDPGETNVLVLINITNVIDGPIQVIMFDVIYDSDVIGLVKARRGSDLPTDEFGDPGWTVKLGTNKKSITIAANEKAYSLANGTTGNIARLYFDVKSTATAGQTSPIELSNMDVVNTGYVHGTIPAINSSFTVTGEVPDLVITAKSETLTDSTLNVTYTITNTGGGDAGASTTGIYAGSTQIATDSVGALSAGASHTSTVTIDPFDCPCDTTVTIKVCADEGDAVDEGDETNNCLENTFSCPPCPGEPQLNTTPDPPSHNFESVPEGETRTWTFDVTNCGGGTLDWTVSGDQTWITVNPTSGTDAVTVTVTINTTGLSDGMHTGTVTVSSDYGTKAGTISVDVTGSSPQQIDLTPTALDIPDPIYVDCDYMLAATISNLGSGDASAFNVTLKVDGVVVDEERVAGLSGNSDTAVSFSWMPDTTGSCTLLVEADSDDEVSETDESNNTFDATVDVLENPVPPPSGAVVTIPDVSATGMITVPITIENVSNVGSCQLTLSYDPDVVIVSSADCSSDFDSLFANLEDATSGSVSILAYQTSNPGLDGDVIVANVTFMAVGKSGSSTPLNLKVTTLTDATPDCNPIPYSIRDGSFTVLLNGDVNGDGRVDVADCMFLAKHLLGVSGFETIIEAAADVNGNGEIEASDCMYLAKHLAGIDGFEVLK